MRLERDNNNSSSTATQISYSKSRVMRHQNNFNNNEPIISSQDCHRHQDNKQVISNNSAGMRKQHHQHQQQQQSRLRRHSRASQPAASILSRVVPTENWQLSRAVWRQDTTADDEHRLLSSSWPHQPPPSTCETTTPSSAKMMIPTRDSTNYNNSPTELDFREIKRCPRSRAQQATAVRCRPNLKINHFLCKPTTFALLLVTTATLLTLLLSAINSSLAYEQAASANDQPKAEPLMLANNNNNKQNSDASSSQNVIIIKYANVSTTTAADQDSTQHGGYNDNLDQVTTTTRKLNVFQLHNEPLSVSVIESKFSHSIQLFDVSQNQLSTLSKDLFCPLSNEVRQLNISRNLLENFDCLGLISQAGQLCLSELKILDMSYNLIKHLPATGVATLHNLEVLDLSHNLIESLDELSLSSLFKLTKLDLSLNRIQQLPVRIFHKSVSMRQLDLRGNHLQTSINQMFLSGLTALEELNLSYNNISIVRELAFLDKTNLTRVDLSHNMIVGLKQEALAVTSPQIRLNSVAQQQQTQSNSAHKTRLHHNGQYAGVAQVSSHGNINNDNYAQRQTTMVEFYLSSNPFICDCHLEWMRKFQQQQQQHPMMLARRTMPPTSTRQHHHHHQGEYMSPQTSGADQLVQLQNDEPTVIQQQQQTSSSSDVSSNNNNNNISENMPTNQQLQQKISISSSATSYGRIADLDLIKCSPLFRRNSLLRSNPARYNAARALAPSDGASSGAQQQHHAIQVHHPNNHLHHHANNNHHQQHHNNQVASSSSSNNNNMIDLLTADASNFLCRYKSHCFALCHCCEFDACDCEMMCPVGCNCYYDSTWQTNIIDCSSNNHTVVPDRIPMDVSGLYLDGNNIDSLKPSNLIARKSLKTLYLNSSNLQYIANRTFNGLIELQTLYLNDNQLRTLNGYEFEPLAQLRALYLHSNRLERISNQTFIYLRSLEILDLSNNRLTSVSMDLFLTIGHHNIRLRQFNFAHNWWSCQCSSIQRFRQILKQKFLLNGGVNIADRNQLRCYYNSTTVGPLILAGDSFASGSPTSLNPFAIQPSQQQPIFASFPQLGSGNGGSNSLGPNNNNRQQQQIQQQQQQQQQLTEINQCSELVEDRPDWFLEFNPPVIQAPASSNQLGSPQLGDQVPPTDDQMQQQQEQTINRVIGQISGNQAPNGQSFQQPTSADQPMYAPGLMAPPVDLFGNPATNPFANNNNQQQQQQPSNLFDQPYSATTNQQQQPNPRHQASGMSLTSFLFLCVLCFCALIIAISIFVLVRQQQRFQHKKSSAASTTSGSSSSASSAAATIAALGHKMPNNSNHHHHHHHNFQQQQQQQHARQQLDSNTGSTTLHHHQQPVGGNHQQHLLQAHHPHSASSHSNIYAALVSPTTGGSTIVTSSAAAASQTTAIFQRQANSANNNNNATNQLYSNSSTTASHHSSSSSTQNHNNHHQQQAMTGNSNNNNNNFASAHQQNQWQQQQIYGSSQMQAYGAGGIGHFDSPYATSGPQGSYAGKSLGGGAYGGPSTTGSLYSGIGGPLAAPGNCDNSPTAVGGPGDWIRLPKVRQFMSKLVNKSLAIGGLRSQASRDELAALTTSDKIYDAFLSYDKRDEQFVMQNLAAELEYGQPQYRVADRYRDLPLPSSDYMAEAITSVIGCSHRTIVVLTENYLASKWCRYELQAAIRESALDKTHKLIAVVPDPSCLFDLDPEMRALLTTTTTSVGAGGCAPAAPLLLAPPPQGQLVQLEGDFQQQQQLVATLTNASAGNQQVSTQTAQLATGRIAFINYNERKFWPKIKQMMPLPRPSTQTLTLTTKN